MKTTAVVFTAIAVLAVATVATSGDGTAQAIPASDTTITFKVDLSGVGSVDFRIREGGIARLENADGTGAIGISMLKKSDSLVGVMIVAIDEMSPGKERIRQLAHEEEVRLGVPYEVNLEEAAFTVTPLSIEHPQQLEQ